MTEVLSRYLDPITLSSEQIDEIAGLSQFPKILDYSTSIVLKDKANEKIKTGV